MNIEESVREILRVPFWEKSNPKTTAILITPGIQDYRISKGSKNWPEKGKYLWVAGTRADPFYSRREVLQRVNRERTGQIDTCYIETQGWANHTLDQMRWAVELLKSYEEVNHIGLSTAAYHDPRCILTLLQTMKKFSDKKVVISPLPIYHPSGPSFESEEFKGEVERVKIYQEKGDVANFDDWKKYLEWREKQ